MVTRSVTTAGAHVTKLQRMPIAEVKAYIEPHLKMYLSLYAGASRKYGFIKNMQDFIHTPLTQQAPKIL